MFALSLDFFRKKETSISSRISSDSLCSKYFQGPAQEYKQKHRKHVAKCLKLSTLFHLPFLSLPISNHSVQNPLGRAENGSCSRGWRRGWEAPERGEWRGQDQAGQGMGDTQSG